MDLKSSICWRNWTRSHCSQTPTWFYCSRNWSYSATFYDYEKQGITVVHQQKRQISQWTAKPFVIWPLKIRVKTANTVMPPRTNAKGRSSRNALCETTHVFLWRTVYHKTKPISKSLELCRRRFPWWRCRSNCRSFVKFNSRLPY
jgi:hypothetical protein